MNQRVIKKVRCNICSAGCPIDAYVEEGTLVSVEGSRDLPGQSGGLCSKGAASRQYVYNKDRILYPMKRIGKKGSGEFERISWDEAYRMIAENLLRIKKEYGPQAAAFYAGYPKWYRPALLRLANAYGSPNYCTESSTCFQSAAMAWRSIYGNDICFPDLMHAQTVLVWSNNLYHSNVGMARPYQSLKARGAKIIAVDPRETVTTQAADIHLKLLPGTDGALALSMAQVIIEEGLYDKEFVEKYVFGFEEYKAYVNQFPPEKAEKITGVDKKLIREAAIMYASNGPAGVMFSASPVVHNINGMQNYRAVMCLIALTGNYDIPGGNPSRPGPVSPCNEYGKVKRLDTKLVLLFVIRSPSIQSSHARCSNYRSSRSIIHHIPQGIVPVKPVHTGPGSTRTGIHKKQGKAAMSANIPAGAAAGLPSAQCLSHNKRPR